MNSMQKSGRERGCGARIKLPAGTFAGPVPAGTSFVCTLTGFVFFGSRNIYLSGLFSSGPQTVVSVL